ncbi:unnamed protein product [Dibothriocephalus latus]|uniref:Uncharacterized protein n=1 Tax=Dibothriocephalus latus TaxID=60516 RepID=A0A3P6SXF1_DIBLA|nr:unnamed protein product [Dibothriocephalus latus]
MSPTCEVSETLHARNSQEWKRMCAPRVLVAKGAVRRRGNRVQPIENATPYPTIPRSWITKHANSCCTLIFSEDDLLYKSETSDLTGAVPVIATSSSLQQESGACMPVSIIIIVS